MAILFRQRLANTPNEGIISSHSTPSLRKNNSIVTRDKPLQYCKDFNNRSTKKTSLFNILTRTILHTCSFLVYTHTSSLWQPLMCSLAIMHWSQPTSACNPWTRRKNRCCAQANYPTYVFMEYVFIISLLENKVVQFCSARIFSQLATIINNIVKPESGVAQLLEVCVKHNIFNPVFINTRGKMLMSFSGSPHILLGLYNLFFLQ